MKLLLDENLSSARLAARLLAHGVVIVRFDNDPLHNLTDRGIAGALGKLEASGIPTADSLHVLNRWR